MEVKLQTSSGDLLQIGAQILGEKVWAAQFQRLDVEYTTIGAKATPLPNQVPLLEVYSKQTQRSDERDVAGITVTDIVPSTTNRAADSTQKGETLDNDYWLEFDKKIVELEEEVDDDD